MDDSICCAAAEAGTQLAIFAFYTLKKNECLSDQINLSEINKINARQGNV